MESYYASITCTSCGAQDLRCVDGLCRNCKWKADCSLKPLTEEALCLPCVVAIGDVVQAVYKRDAEHCLTCNVCGTAPECGQPVRVYTILTECSPSFVPVQDIKCVNCGETGQPHRAYDKLCKLCGDLWPTGQMYTRSEFYK